MIKKLLLGLCLAGILVSQAFAGNTYTSIGKANYTALSTDYRIVPTVALTANRTITLPYAAATCVGAFSSILGQGNCATSLDIVDAFGNVGGSNSCLVITAQTGDLLNGVSGGSITWCNPFGRLVLRPIGGTSWVVDDNEVISTTILAANAVSLTTATAANVVGQASYTLVLQPGEWDCRAFVARTFTSSTSYTVLSALLSTTSTAAAPTAAQIGAGQGVELSSAADVPGVTIGPSQTIGPYRFSVAAATNLYLAVTDTFTASTDAAYGNITCRRAL
jgi:hypothetical protein